MLDHKDIGLLRYEERSPFLLIESAAELSGIIARSLFAEAEKYAEDYGRLSAEFKTLVNDICKVCTELQIDPLLLATVRSLQLPAKPAMESTNEFLDYEANEIPVPLVSISIISLISVTSSMRESLIPLITGIKNSAVNVQKQLAALVQKMQEMKKDIESLQREMRSLIGVSSMAGSKYSEKRNQLKSLQDDENPHDVQKGKKSADKRRRAIIGSLHAEIAALKKQIDKQSKRQTAKQTSINGKNDELEALERTLEETRISLLQVLSGEIQETAIGFTLKVKEISAKTVTKEEAGRWLSDHADSHRPAFIALYQQKEEERIRRNDLRFLYGVTESVSEITDSFMEHNGLNTSRLIRIADNAFGKDNTMPPKLLEGFLESLRRHLPNIQSFIRESMKLHGTVPSDIPFFIELFSTKSQQCLKFAENGTVFGRRLSKHEKDTFYLTALHFKVCIEDLKKMLEPEEK